MSRRKKKPQPLVPPSGAPPSLPLYKRMWVVVAGAVSIAFTAGLNGPTLLENARKLPGEIEKTWTQYASWRHDDQAWTGDWSTFPEGILDVTDMRLSEGVDLKITLLAEGGELGGVIAAGTICSALPYDYLQVRGRVSGNTAQLEVWDILQGQQVVFDRLKLIRDGDVITVHPAAGSDWFPANARIGKHPVRDEAFVNHFCKRPITPHGTDNEKRVRKPVSEWIRAREERASAPHRKASGP